MYRGWIDKWDFFTLYFNIFPLHHHSLKIAILKKLSTLCLLQYPLATSQTVHLMFVQRNHFNNFLTDTSDGTLGLSLLPHLPLPFLNTPTTNVPHLRKHQLAVAIFLYASLFLTPQI